MLTLIDRRLAALDAWFARRTAFLAHPRMLLLAAVLVPLLFGLVSVVSGQDDTWDQRNYHLYNVYALLHHRIGFDFAPGRFQNYFNPTLDLVYYGLNQLLPPRLAGFVLGALHGLNFVLLVALARQLLGADQDQDGGAHRRKVLLLAGACVFGPGFLSEIGNGMGDNLTALSVLGSLWLLLRHWAAPRLALILLAGLVMGLGVGLKLTNATYAVAACAALLAMPGAWWQRLRGAFVYGVGVLAGMAVTAGWWCLKMWQLYGNPLFPQFNDIFQSPMALTVGVVDTYFRPQGWLENLLWPFVFALNPLRLAEVPMKLAVWPLVYTLMLVFAVLHLARRLRGTVPALPSRQTFMLLFFALAYLCWMRLFSIYRYLVPLELLAPLVIWLLWRQIAPAAPRIAGVALALLVLGVFPVANWGRAEWGAQLTSAELPALPSPGSTIVFIAQPHPPMAWMATMYPEAVRFIGVDTGFPESALYRQRMRAAIAERSGPHYVMIAAAVNEKEGTRQRKLATAQWLGLTQDAAGCGKLDWLLRHSRLQVTLRQLPAGGCTFDLLPQHVQDLAALDRATLDEATQHLARYGLQVDGASCSRYAAAMGRQPYPYRLCRVTPAAQGAPVAHD